MNRKIYSSELIFFSNKNINIVIVIVITLFSSNLLLSTLEEKLDTNVYDLLMQMTAFLPLSYMVIPTFLIVVTAHFSQGEVNNYLFFRFKSKRHWYRTNVILIAQMASAFIFTIMAIMLTQSAFLFSFKNNWSESSLEHYNYFVGFLANYSPVVYVIVTVILLWLLLFLLGLIFYLIFLWTKNPILSFLFVFLLNLINVAVFLGGIESLSRFLFMDHISIIEYIHAFGLSQENFPYSIFLYWIILIAIVYLLGLFVVNRVDFSLGKGDKNGAR